MSYAKILIVEDEGIVAMDIAERLTNLGFTVVGTAGCGKDAIKLTESKNPDLILIDVRRLEEVGYDGVLSVELEDHHFTATPELQKEGLLRAKEYVEQFLKGRR